MLKPTLRSPSCAAVLFAAAIVSTPALLFAQSTTTSAPAKATNHSMQKPVATQTAPLDLHAPPLNHIYPREQLQYIMAVDSSDAQSDDAQEVNVKGSKYFVPVPVSQFRAIPWALMHPTDAWRIFTPIQEP